MAITWKQSPAPNPQTPANTQLGFAVEKASDSVSPRDIFKLAKTILAVAAGIYLLMAVLRISSCSGIIQDNMKDVWDYTKVFLNSIISLVLGLYFGAKKEDAKKDNKP